MMKLFEPILLDVRYGTRTLLRNTGFTIVSIFALALGIGINTSVFTAYKTLVGRPLDARDPGRMVDLGLILKSGTFSFLFSYPDYEIYRDQLHACSGVIAWAAESLPLTDAGGIVTQRTAAAGSLFGRLGLLPPGATNAEFASTFVVSENYFSVLGVAPLRGRSFESIAAADLTAAPVVLISENYRQKRFAGDPEVLGKTIRLNGAPFTIIGVTRRDFVGTSVVVPDFWLPLRLYPLIHPETNVLRDRENLQFRAFGRLAPGVSIRQAQAEMNVIATHIRSLHEAASPLNKPATAFVSPGSPLPGRLSAALKLTVLLVMVAAGMVLVIACANVASLQLARATTRQNELSMRISLGASRRRIVRQLLTESAMLGLLAGFIALPVTWGILNAGATMFKQAFPMEMGALVLNVTPDLEVFGYVLAISVSAGLLFGVVPAFESSRSALFSAVRGGAGASTLRSRRVRDVLISSQVAVSLVLTIAGSMLIRSSLQALSMPTGYDGKQVLDLDFRFPETADYNQSRKLALLRELRVRLAALPGVGSVTSARAPDDNRLRAASVSLTGENPAAQNTRATLYYTWVEPNYFQTLGCRLLLGNGFKVQAGQPEHSVILSESAVRQLWPGRNPVGHTLRLGTEGRARPKTELVPDGAIWQVIGVAADMRGVLPDGGDSAQVYLPLPDDRVADYPILIRTHRDAALIAGAVDNAAASVDRRLIVSTSTLEEMLRETPTFLGATFAAAIAITIGLFGFLLAAMGIYATVSYVVVQRTRELGIRVAIGAQKSDIVALIMRESARPVCAGLIVGMLLAIGSARLLRGVLYGVNAVDAISFAAASALFLTVALLATLPPSRRAMRVDPAVALRYN